MPATENPAAEIPDWRKFTGWAVDNNAADFPFLARAHAPPKGANRSGGPEFVLAI